jgi:DNA-directed RNA polymerase subunit M/transcription elongation factor TFIIS
MTALLVTWAAATALFAGLLIGRHSTRPELRSLRAALERYRALQAMAGSESGESFIVQKLSSGTGTCPTCGMNKGSFPDCAGRCSRGAGHVHVKCAHCGLEWVRVP